MNIREYSSWPKPTAAATRPTHARTLPTVKHPAAQDDRPGELSTSRCLTPAAEAAPTSRLMTLEEVAQFLAVSPRWIYDNYQSLGMLTTHVEPDQDLLFTSPRTRGPLHRDYYRQSIWIPAIRAAGLPPDTTFHDLRHSFASTALAGGVPLLEVSRWLGHASITETADTYGHLLPHAIHRTPEALDRAWTGDETTRRKPPMPQP